MTTLAYTRRGSGPPLVLIHALGSARQAWDPVLDALAERFDVIAVDLPGFGASEPLPAEVEPLPEVLAASVAAFLDGLGVANPHVAGNSLGGWVALELAGLRPVASLTLLGPAGLWRDRPPLYNRVSLRATRWLAEHATGLLSRLMRYRLARIVVLGQTHGRPSRITPQYARMAVRAMACSPGFRATMKATEGRCYRSATPIAAPVTVGFGTRDFLLLPWQSRHVDQLPPGARVVTLRGCGHVPMADDPAAVAALVSEHLGPVHLAERIGQQLEPGTIGIPEVD
jgi:pimeloyl-ACP methyl ester carboxylesterase